MAKDVFPYRDSDLANWSNNYKVKISDNGATVGLSPAQITEQQGWCQDIIDEITAVEQARNAFSGVVVHKKNTVKARKNTLRTAINQIKTHPGFTEQIGETLDVFTTKGDFDPDTFKPTAKATVYLDQVRIDFSKDQCDGVNIYARLKGTGTWTFLGRDNFPPYADTRPLATPNVTETREYMVRGLVGDTEVGVVSDIVIGVFGG